MLDHPVTLCVPPLLEKEAKTNTVPAQEALMQFYSKLIVALIVLAGIEIAWLTRWEIVAASTEDHPMAYQLDRWTGNVYLLGSSGDGRVRLSDK